MIHQTVAPRTGSPPRHSSIGQPLSPRPATADAPAATDSGTHALLDNDVWQTLDPMDLPTGLGGFWDFESLNAFDEADAFEAALDVDAETVPPPDDSRPAEPVSSPLLQALPFLSSERLRSNGKNVFARCTTHDQVLRAIRSANNGASGSGRSDPRLTALPGVALKLQKLGFDEAAAVFSVMFLTQLPYSRLYDPGALDRCVALMPDAFPAELLPLRAELVEDRLETVRDRAARYRKEGKSDLAAVFERIAARLAQYAAQQAAADAAVLCGETPAAGGDNKAFEQLSRDLRSLQKVDQARNKKRTITLDVLCECGSLSELMCVVRSASDGGKQAKSATAAAPRRAALPSLARRLGSRDGANSRQALLSTMALANPCNSLRLKEADAWLEQLPATFPVALLPYRRFILSKGESALAICEKKARERNKPELADAYARLRARVNVYGAQVEAMLTQSSVPEATDMHEADQQVQTRHAAATKAVRRARKRQHEDIVSTPADTTPDPALASTAVRSRPMPTTPITTPITTPPGFVPMHPPAMHPPAMWVAPPRHHPLEALPIAQRPVELLPPGTVAAHTTQPAAERNLHDMRVVLQHRWAIAQASGRLHIEEDQRDMHALALTLALTDGSPQTQALVAQVLGTASRWPVGVPFEFSQMRRLMQIGRPDVIAIVNRLLQQGLTPTK